MEISAILFLLAALLVPLPVCGQEVVLNEEGRRIVVYPDGSWKYFENDELRQNTDIFTPGDEVLAGNRLLFDQAQNLEKELTLKLVQLRLERVELEEELAQLQSQKNAAPAGRLSVVEARLRNMPDREKQVTTDLEKARERAVFLEQIMYLPAEIHAKKLAEWANERGQTGPSPSPSAPTTKKNYLTYEISRDVMLTPPARPCQAIFEGPTAAGGTRIDLAPEVMFTHTDPALSSQFVKGNFIVGAGYLTGVSGGSYALTLEVQIGTMQAPKYFGAFKSGDFIEFQLLDGKVVRLFNKINDPGTWQPATQTYVYRAQFGIGTTEEKLLRSMELDLVRVRWSKVKEEYPLYELDFFTRQFECIDKLRGS